jgi:hypothetical protein
VLSKPEYCNIKITDLRAIFMCAECVSSDAKGRNDCKCFKAPCRIEYFERREKGQRKGIT